MAESDDAKKKRIQHIGHLIGEAIIMTVKGPESGQTELTEEEKAKIKSTVADAFETFLHHSEWKAKTDPLINEFKVAHLPKLLKQRAENRISIDEAIKEAFPSLEPELESHAVLNLIATLVSVGPFRKIKDDTLAKIVEEAYTLTGLVIAYLHWRVISTIPPKGDQH